MFYSMSEQKNIRNDHPEMKMTDIVKIVAQKWS
jgi:hypothetical protein